MSILARLQCAHVTRGVNSETPALAAVTATSEENKTWSQHTPSGRLELQITNPSAFGFFEPGEEYVVIIEKAAK